MDLQEIFDKAVTGVIGQGCQSLVDDSTCMLRGENGTKCAVGWLIPDGKYEVEFEKFAYLTSSKYESETTRGEYNPKRFTKTALGTVLEEEIGTIDKIKFRLLQSLQDCHDSSSHFEMIGNYFADTAKAFNLNTKALDKARETSGNGEGAGVSAG